MSQDGKNLHGGYPQFQGLIDDVLGKDDPAACIPWPASSRPAWASGFTPASVLDLGAATGRFTASVLTCLGDWGCLTDLRRLHLVEEEPGFDGSDDPMVEDSIIDRCRTALASHRSGPIEILLSNETVGLTAGAEAGHLEITIGTEKAEAAGLIIASHFTYYFPDGARSLLKALANALRRSGGLGWIVVRRRDCPIYRERERHFAFEGETPDTYAEDLQAWIATPNSGLELVDARDQGFLLGPAHPASHIDVASLLMWRRPLDALAPTEREALEKAHRSVGSLFVERHLIVRCAD